MAWRGGGEWLEAYGYNEAKKAYLKAKKSSAWAAA